jgi:hypothetical protein
MTLRGPISERILLRGRDVPSLRQDERYCAKPLRMKQNTDIRRKELVPDVGAGLPVLGAGLSAGHPNGDAVQGDADAPGDGNAAAEEGRDSAAVGGELKRKPWAREPGAFIFVASRPQVDAARQAQQKSAHR